MAYSFFCNKICDISNYFTGVEEALESMPREVIGQVIDILLTAYTRQRTIFICGNGGSAALASHLACDLGKGLSDLVSYRMRVLSLTDNVPLITAWGNDTAYADIFAEQLKNFVQPSDVVLAISCSGNSPNVLNCLRTATEAGAITVGFTGFQGGKMKQLCDRCVIVPSDSMQIIEDLHVIIAHGMYTIMRNRLRQLDIWQPIQEQSGAHAGATMKGSSE